MSELDNIVKELNKRFGKNTIISGSDMSALEVERVSTGSLSMDIETGGGLPCGRLVEIYGHESSGKSFIAAKTVAEAQKVGKKCVWIDVEGSFDPVWAAKLGVDTESLFLSRPETGEQAGDILDAVIRSGDCGVVVLDSTAALIPEKDTETAMEDVERIGNKAQMINRLVRKLHSALNMKVGEDMIPNNCLTIFINQIRQKVGVMYGNPETTPGGLGLKFGASLRIEVSKKIIKDENDEEKVVGQTVRFKTVKNKTFPPFRRGEFNIYLDGDRAGEIDGVGEVVTYGLLTGLISQTGHTFTVGKDKVVGKDNLVEFLRAKPDVVASFKAQIVDYYFGNGPKPKEEPKEKPTKTKEKQD